MLVYVIVKAAPKNIISICYWIDNLCDPLISRSGEYFSVYTHLLVALSYIYSLQTSTYETFKNYLYSFSSYYLSNSLSYFSKYISFEKFYKV
jgi:hypothetical protein